jgi:hypothetical protein
MTSARLGGRARTNRTYLFVGSLVVVLAGLFAPGWLGAGLLFAVVTALLVVLLVTARARPQAMRPGVILVRLVILTAFLAVALHKIS